MIDWARIAELREEVGPDSFDEVAALFLEESDEAVQRLSAGAGAAGLESGLHFLKGAALNLGFSRLAGLCQEGERRAAQGACDIDLDQIRAAYQASRAAFEAGPEATPAS